MPQVEIDIATDKERYEPGETVTVTLATRFAGKPVSSHLTVSVVDEMVYALQAEIAPGIDQFFYHPRRNNVRTSASLAFISYDVALPGSTSAPGRANRRARRQGTGAAAPRGRRHRRLAAGSHRRPGQGQLQLPHARLADPLADHRAGHRRQRPGRPEEAVPSLGEAAVRWSGPTRFRQGDQPDLGLFVFNQGEQPVRAARSAGRLGQRSQTLSWPGSRYIPLAQQPLSDGDWSAELRQDGQVRDRLAVRFNLLADGCAGRCRTSAWRRRATRCNCRRTRDVRLRLADGPAAAYLGNLDDLLEYPYGGVEQTASQLLPLSIAYPALAGGEPRIRDRLRLIMQNSRLRLVQMAGPDAWFAWWGGDVDGDAFLTAYAYYADWYASRADPGFRPRHAVAGEHPARRPAQRSGQRRRRAGARGARPTTAWCWATRTRPSARAAAQYWRWTWHGNCGSRCPLRWPPRPRRRRSACVRPACRSPMPCWPLTRPWMASRPALCCNAWRRRNRPWNAPWP